MGLPRCHLVVVGGGPAGHSAARAYREAGGQGVVRLISADSQLPYARPPLSKEYLRGEAEDADLPMEPPGFYSSLGILATTGTAVAAIDPESREIRLADGEALSYGHCILATGSRPVRPPVPGGDNRSVHLLRSASSGRTLRQAAARARTAAVVGSGFIGCEAAVSLARRGIRVTLISQESLPQQARLGDAAGERIVSWLVREGIDVRPGATLESIEDGRVIHSDAGSPVEADLILLATGVQPRIELAEQAGLEIESGRVCADDHMRTSAPEVLAAGDVALAYNSKAERRLPVEHWGEALTMGEIAGATAARTPASWTNVPGFWSVIGDRVLKYAAWGDGFDQAHLVEHGSGAFTVWYGLRGTAVGVLTHRADRDYERGAKLVETGAPCPVD